MIKRLQHYKKLLVNRTGRDEMCAWKGSAYKKLL